MTVHIGVKSDPIEYRYSFEWLFRLMEEYGIGRLQLGSFLELYSVDPTWLHDLSADAAERGIEIRSCFTAHRELGGFFFGDQRLEAVASQNYRRWIDVAAEVGARYCGSNPGSVYRDKLEWKQHGIERYISHMAGLMEYARARGLAGLLIEPMSSAAEPPATPDEIHAMMRRLAEAHARAPEETVPVYLCSDTSHGVAERSGTLLHPPLELFAEQAQYMAEFHFKNTDSSCDATFGFGPDAPRGIIDLRVVKDILESRAEAFPTADLTGYLEISGPKLGRDYSDYLLEGQLRGSIETLLSVFGT